MMIVDFYKTTSMKSKVFKMLISLLITVSASLQVMAQNSGASSATDTGAGANTVNASTITDPNGHRCLPQKTQKVTAPVLIFPLQITLDWVLRTSKTTKRITREAPATGVCWAC